MKYTGLYINLDRNADRRAAIEGELARNGLGGYMRFAASLGNALEFPNPVLKAGEVGCFTSHYLLLDQHRGATRPLHVIEDDIILSPQTGQVLDWAIDSGQLAKFDIVFTDVAVPLLNDACHAYKTYYDAAVRRGASGVIESVAFSTVNMRELIFGSTCSFLVNPLSIGKLADLFGGVLRAGAALPIDLTIRKLCHDGVLRVGCIFPFVTSIAPASALATTIEKRFDDLPAIAANMLRHSFFIGCDGQKNLAEAERLLAQPDAGDLHRELMLRLLGFSLTAEYRKC